MSTVADYIGRQVDLAVFHGTTPNTVAALALPGTGGSVIAGIAKLTASWIIEFMTQRGSIPHQPERGSSFLARFRSGALRTTAEVERSFAIAAAEVRRSLQAVELSTDPADERYGSATLESATVAAGSLSLRVRLTSLAGDDHVLLLPISATLS